MKTPTSTITRPHRGFTLVELLVAITIVIVLAALAFTITRTAMQKAKAAAALNGLRQCGAIILADAPENNGQITLFSGGKGHKEQRLISRAAIGFDLDPNENQQVYQATRSFVYTPAKDPGKYDSWGTYGVNIDDNEELGVVWKRKWEEDKNGTRGWIRKINPGLVGRPSSYPLIADSSNSQGKPRLRFSNGDEYKFAMRYAQKGAAVFLDGSCRMVGVSKMGKYGITDAYLFEDGPKGKPVLVTAEEE